MFNSVNWPLCHQMSSVTTARLCWTGQICFDEQQFECSLLGVIVKGYVNQMSLFSMKTNGDGQENGVLM